MERHARRNISRIIRFIAFCKGGCSPRARSHPRYVNHIGACICTCSVLIDKHRLNWRIDALVTPVCHLGVSRAVRQTPLRRRARRVYARGAAGVRAGDTLVGPECSKVLRCQRKSSRVVKWRRTSWTSPRRFAVNAPASRATSLRWSCGSKRTAACSRAAIGRAHVPRRLAIRSPPRRVHCNRQSPAARIHRARNVPSRAKRACNVSERRNPHADKLRLLRPDTDAG